MARKIIDIGTIGNDGTGDSIRESFRKVNDNFRELYSSLGLGERLKFINLDDTPARYEGYENAVLAVGADPAADEGLSVKFKQIQSGVGILVDTTSNPESIIINSEFSEISNDKSPALGGDLSAQFGGQQFKIINLADPESSDEAARKGYVDQKIALRGTESTDTDGTLRPEWGVMGGPLILSRDPEPEDDERFGGRIAATKRYVDSSAFGSSVNLYVATSGRDERPGVSPSLQGRALAYAFRTIEAACKKAEEILLESPLEIGPYKKLITYNDGAEFSTLSYIDESPDSGADFAGRAILSVDQIHISEGGTGYNVGDDLQLVGGTGEKATYRVLTVTTAFGAVRALTQISSGSYTYAGSPSAEVLPGSTNVETNAISGIGVGLKVNVTYKVTGVNISNEGSGYSLVSARITGGGGSGAFGVATVDEGRITQIEITDQGNGFTSEPTVIVNLPRLAIQVGDAYSDFTGDLLTDTPVANRAKDIREGLFLRGESSGALAQILAHGRDISGGINGKDSENNELFDVDIKFGNFEIGELIAYGDVTNQTQITIKVESGVYDENFPIKLPQNTSIVGDEFRRVIVRPKVGTSSSPWAFQKFRRDLTIDGLTVANRLFGYHYLQDSSQPVYPKIDNRGNYKQAASLLSLNKNFVAAETVAWIDQQITNDIAPFSVLFEYDREICQRDVGLLIDAMIFDLKYGNYNRTISAGLKYYGNASGRIAITTQLSQTIAGIEKAKSLILDVIQNNPITGLFQTLFPQIVDAAFTSETGSDNVLEELFTAFIDVIDGSGSVNYPKENDQMDMFLANDACRWQGITGQGHGGFMLVLDPEGQILAKSPYAQECACFSKSIDKHTFAGGMFVDGFAGNLQFTHETTIPGTANTRITVANLDRFPQLPASFIVDDNVFRINYVRDFAFDKEGSTATFVLDETTPFTRPAGFQNFTITTGNPGIFSNNDHQLQPGATLKFRSTGTLPSPLVDDREYFVLALERTSDQFTVTDTFGSVTPVEITTSGSGTLQYQRIYEVLMPGNRSMLSNDYTQINDLGYGLVATNGGLTEAVSMFTYYCHISYYSLNGGQIRSVSGSSAHGNYALVAEGADPLEVPTPVTLFYDLSQRVECYFPTPDFKNEAEGLTIFVTGYDYVPMNNSELEIDHGHLIYRYPVNSVSTTGLPDGVARLSLTSDDTGNFDGLFAIVPDGTVMTIRSNSQVILTGDIVDVATRPSTGLVLRESTDVYRILQFDEFEDTRGIYEIVSDLASPSNFSFLVEVITISTNVCTTSQNHTLVIGDKFVPTSTSNGFVSGTTYYVISVPAYNQFTVSTSLGGSVETLSNGTGLSIKGKISNEQLQNYIVGFYKIDTFAIGQISGNTLTVSAINSGPPIAVGTTILGDGITDTTTVTAFGSGTGGTGTYTLSNSFTISSDTEFVFRGRLPTGLVEGDFYYVLSEGLTDTEFRLGETIEGDAISITDAGIAVTYGKPQGLARTTLRENYNYIDLTVNQPNDYVTTPTACTFILTPGSAGIIQTSSAHGLSQGDCIRIESTGNFPIGINAARHFFVFDPDPDSVGAGSTKFTISTEYPTLASAVEITFSGSPTGAAQFGLVKGRAGDQTFAVVPVSPGERSRVPNSKFVFQGEEYVITDYESEEDTGGSFARITLDRPLVDSVIEFGGSYTIKSAVPKRSNGANGNLTIRISLTRVTSHDLLEIGTGSYADTNYPAEIYGAAVNPLDADSETEERDVGRVFYVTTDQFGNFNVGPYFRVDQGTGRVTFSAAIALSNLDGIGFKRGVPIAEFSVDNTFADNAVDTVPTENATRQYIDKRLGLSHSGEVVDVFERIPSETGGFMALDGQLPMLNNMNLNNFKIVALADPVLPQDGVNLRSLTLDNFQDLSLGLVKANDIIVFTGDGNSIASAEVVGDISLNIDSTAFSVDAQINPGVILDADVNASAAIAQSKLSMNSATTRANATGIAQADRGLASFDSAQFTATDGWITVKDNGLLITKIQQIATKTVVGNSSASTATPTEVLFTTVVSDGGAIKKTQYSSGTGVLYRNSGTGTLDSHYTIVDMSSTYTGVTDANKLIRRDGSGDFQSRVGNLQKLQIDSRDAIDTSTTSTGGYIQLYAYGGSGGISLYGGSPSDTKNVYDNDSHIFRTQDGLNPAPIQASSIQVTAITTGGNTTGGTITGRWTLTGTSPNESRLQATYSADLAEYYEGDKEYEVGTVLVFGGEKEVTTSNIKIDTRVAGVVSNTAAFVMYDACPGHKNLIGLQGRLPCKVVGKINKGDLLVTSGIPGVAQSANNDAKIGSVIGKALENYDSDHIGKIQIAVGRT